MTTLDSIVAHYAPLGRSGLLPALQAAQVLDGWLSHDTLAAIALGVGVPLAEAYGVATFYSMLYTEPVGRKFIRVCDDVLCQLAGADHLIADLETQLGIRCGSSTAEGALA
ncbi:MAG: NAD(P)H-dependent oxidoreductase subunit E, partial [Chloroflexi bacterium]|nr:NAD(P)H-dependent oxidoreductase subunit E [Chloroflexota bacterium]